MVIANEAVPPREPFAYMSDQNASIPKIREPILEILFGACIAAAGVLILGMEIIKAANGTSASVGAAVFVFLMFGGLGGFAIYMGARRLRWKRAYRRTMGRDPW